MKKSAAVRMRSEVRGKGQITIPTPVRRSANIKEGDLLEFEITRGGIFMRPLKLIDALQAWFWEEDWQKGEAQASADIKAKRTTHHKSGAEFLSSLKK
jgi:AbrB family looped-hinge helix DNA binding protein